MSTLMNRNLLLDPPQENLFLAALAEIDWLLPGRREVALAHVTHALAFALPEDRHVLNVLARCLSRVPFDEARKALQRYGKAHPEHEQRIGSCTPTTDPGLYIKDIGPIFHTGLDVAEMPRPSLRHAFRPPLLSARPTPETDRRVHAPAAIADRARRHAWHLIMREFDTHGTRQVYDLLRVLPKTVAEALSVRLGELERDGIIHRPTYPDEYSLTGHGVAVHAAHIRRPVEPPIVTEYFRRHLFSDWQANLDRARRSRNTARENALIFEVAIPRDEAAIRAGREFVRPFRIAATAEAVVRAEQRAADPSWRIRRSRALPSDVVAEAWDRVYLDYVAEQLVYAALHDDPRPQRPKAGPARVENTTAVIADAYRRQSTRYTRSTDAVHTDGYHAELPEARAADRGQISPELVHEISTQLSDSHYDARPLLSVDEDSTRRASIRTGIWISTDYRDAPEHRGDGFEVDHDNAANPPVTGWRCVWCFIERSSLDRHSSDRQRSDDGLCEYCRADGRPGILPLPDAFTYTDTVTAHCAFLAREYPTLARTLLRDQWRRSGKGSRTAEAIQAFMQAHPEIPNTSASQHDAAEPVRPRTIRSSRQRGPVIGKGQRRDRCTGCVRDTAVHHDGYCTSCRVELGIVTPTKRPSRRAA
ncbi:winged helix-turn-helix transcriptional regulator [Nocardia abscessus]|uniref:winged helix-turn-helix transcriptional regulator n=1 Tax=Nocardia abscessus TaxID=120957 RepID=UPI001894D60F|nr:winged helix-turn-helix transcriptional regulator [Nocardia abscessus]MBF6341260.1 winged helix-turn-helix transcriptional regulator [Nocardia abscessus]